jgi:hypothetical protein
MKENKLGCYLPPKNTIINSYLQEYKSKEYYFYNLLTIR